RIVEVVYERNHRRRAAAEKRRVGNLIGDGGRHVLGEAAERDEDEEKENRKRPAGGKHRNKYVVFGFAQPGKDMECWSIGVMEYSVLPSLHFHSLLLDFEISPRLHLACAGLHFFDPYLFQEPAALDFLRRDDLEAF